MKTASTVNLEDLILPSSARLPNAGAGVDCGAELLRFVEAVLVDQSDLECAREVVRSKLTAAALVDVCATVASFNAVVKVADGTGIPLEDTKREKTADLREQLSIDQLRDRGRFVGE